MQLKDTRLVKILMEKYSCAKLTMFDFIFLFPFVALIFMTLLYSDILKHTPNSVIFFVTFLSFSIFTRRCKVIFRNKKDSTK